MIRSLLLILCLQFLVSCAPKNVVENTRQTTQSIADAMSEAGEVIIADNEAPSDDILDELLPGSGIGVPGLSEDIEQETAFDMSVSNAPAKLFFMSLVRDTEINMIVHPSVEGEISLDLKNVTVREVLILTREVYGYEFKESNSGFIVLPAKIQSKIFTVDYLNVNRKGESLMWVNSGQVSSTEVRDNTGIGSSTTKTKSDNTQSSSINTSITSNFWFDLRQTLIMIIGVEKGRSVIVDPNSGLVVVRAMPGELRDVEDYLSRAQENLQRQVILEAKIIEVVLNDSFQSGIDWKALSSSGEVGALTTGVLNDRNIILDGGLFENLEIPKNTDTTNMFAVGVDTADFTGLIRLLSTQGEVQVLSSPRVSTVNNQKAVIKVGTDEFFVTDVSSNSNANISGTTFSPDITLTPFFSGIALDVTPQISDDGHIILHMHPSISDVQDQQKEILLGETQLVLPLALSTIRESDSVVRARSGQVIVVGGLMENISQDEDAGLPGVSDVPGLGVLFKQQSQKNRRTELVILLRPLVVDTNKTWSKYIKDSAGRIEKLKYDTEGE
ncbi:MAG: pilus (MSHA type) biogenesis protein MshL [Gammaproteobacteria bacterium]|nr:MAG: pilus (MSHA type) biogenesis protein MshL [Gammaproteobacteria bacterium]